MRHNVVNHNLAVPNLDLVEALKVTADGRLFRKPIRAIQQRRGLHEMFSSS